MMRQDDCHRHPGFDKSANRRTKPPSGSDCPAVRPDEGYTLVEMMVTIAIFSIVMSLIAVSFNRIVASSGKVIKAVETDIGGLIGLELLRVDLGYAGFGLPWSLNGITYSEAGHHLVGGDPDTDAAGFNDAPDYPPRAFAMLNNKGMNGSDYLVLKGTAVDGSDPTRSWSFLTYSTGSVVMKPSKSPATELVAGNGDRAIVINSGVRGGESFRDLVTDGASFCLKLDSSGIPPAFRPKGPQDCHLVYGIAPAPDRPEDDVVSFPFNRADYYLGPSDRLSTTCAPGTGMLYKGQISQKGNFSSMPILDCVADLQVIFMMDTSSDGSLVPQNDISPDALTGANGLFPGVDPAQALREHVKEVRVYVLAQQGKKDAGYRYPVVDPNRVIVLGDPVNGKAWSQSALAATFGGDWAQYHWKVYTIAVQPKNLE